MTLNIGKEVASLERMTIGELRERYAELFRESTRTCNKTWLIRRLAWRKQRRMWKELELGVNSHESTT